MEDNNRTVFNGVENLILYGLKEKYKKMKKLMIKDLMKAYILL